MKILYAASANHNAKIQLSRFLKAVGNEHQIKVAAYKMSSPKNISIDWTLDALLNIHEPETLSLDGDNIEVYYQQIKDYAPDLVISDLEYFTSYLSNLLNLRVWQCSSSLINYALPHKDKYNLGLFKFYAHSLMRTSTNNQRMVNIISNSERNFVYSHFGDMPYPHTLQPHFEWVRPYHQVYKSYIPCQHLIVAGLSKNNKQILDMLKKYPDSVVFMDSTPEKYQNLRVKDIALEDEYYCNLKNCDLFVCQGQSSFLADAYYNGQFSIIYPDYQDSEAIINSHLSDKLDYGEILRPSTDIASYINSPSLFLSLYNKDIKFLHEKIREIMI